MGPDLVMAGLITIGLTLYALLGGADFGAGVWEFNLAFGTDRKGRDLTNRALGPVWEANHVWLIFVIVCLSAGFPPAFAALGRALWVPLSLAACGIVFRGVAFTFRSHAEGAPMLERIWGGVFAFASCAAPFFLGACAWAVASGRLPEDPTPFGWVSPYSIFGGFFSVALCAFVAAAYLAREVAGRPEERLWRTRAVASGVWMGALAMTGLFLMAKGMPQIWDGFRIRAWPVIGLSVVAGVSAVCLLVARRYTPAAVAAAAAAATIVVGWCLAQYPALVPPRITVASARAPDAALRTMVWTMLGGGLLVAPSMIWLLILFKRK